MNEAEICIDTKTRGRRHPSFGETRLGSGNASPNEAQRILLIFFLPMLRDDVVLRACFFSQCHKLCTVVFSIFSCKLASVVFPGQDRTGVIEIKLPIVFIRCPLLDRVRTHEELAGCPNAPRNSTDSIKSGMDRKTESVSNHVVHKRSY